MHLKFNNSHLIGQKFTVLHRCMHAMYYVDHDQWDGWIKQKTKKKMESTNLELSIHNVCIFPIKQVKSLFICQVNVKKKYTTKIVTFTVLSDSQLAKLKKENSSHAIAMKSVR